MYGQEISDVNIQVLRFLISFIVSSICALWVAYDSSRRRMNWIIWPLFVFLCCPIGMIWYLLVRGPIVYKNITETIDNIVPSVKYPPTKKCPYCAETIKEEATVCKHCKSDLTSSTKKCPYCAEVINKEAVICGHCKSHLT